MGNQRGNKFMLREVVSELSPGVLDNFRKVYGTDIGKFVVIGPVIMVAPYIKTSDILTQLSHTDIVRQALGPESPSELQVRLNKIREGIDPGETIDGKGYGVIDAGHLCVEVTHGRLSRVNLSGNSFSFDPSDRKQRRKTLAKFRGILDTEDKIEFKLID